MCVAYKKSIILINQTIKVLLVLGLLIYMSVITKKARKN